MFFLNGAIPSTFWWLQNCRVILFLQHFTCKGPQATSQTSTKYGCGCGSVGRAVATNTRGPRFESSPWQTFILIIWIGTMAIVGVVSRGQVVSVLTFCSSDPSSNLAEVCCFLLWKIVGKVWNELKLVEGRIFLKATCYHRPPVFSSNPSVVWEK